MPIADYKQFLNLRSNRPFHLGYYPPHAAGVTPYAEPTVGLPNPTNLMCGWCNNPYLQHPVTDVWGDLICKRPLSDFHVDNDYDYYADTHLTVKDAQPAPSYDEDNSEPTGVSIDYDYKADTYRDEYPITHRKEPNGTYTIIDGEFTSASHWWSTGKPTPTAYREGSKQAVGNLPTNAGISSKGAPVIIDGSAEFTSVQVFDPEVTERYALRSILNYYVDQNTGDTRLGGLILSRHENTFRAKCVRNDWTTNRCNSKVLSIDLDTADRNAMENFTLSVIRHGNNHAAPWFTKRATFYKVHHEDCDLLCNPDVASCDVSAAEERRLTLLLSELQAQYAHAN